jgi:hypothetical protein
MEALASTQHGLLSRTQAFELGLSSKAIEHGLRNRHWHRVGRGVYRLAGAIETPRLRAMTAVLAAGEGAALSHKSAAALHDLPGFHLEPLIVSIKRTRRSLSGVRLEQSMALQPEHCQVVDSIRCTTVARTLFDLCGDVNARRAERALDTALARKLVTRPALWRVLDELAEHGRAGTVLFRTLLTEREPDYTPPESELEVRFIELVVAHGLAEPERQVDLGDRDGWIGRVDFLFRAARLVVEVDGAEFHDGLVDQRRDSERDARLVAAGWHVLRFRWDDIVNRPDAVARAIRFRGELHPS